MKRVELKKLLNWKVLLPILGVILVVVICILCFRKSEAEITITYTGDKAYKYESVNLEDFSVTEVGKHKTKKYTLESGKKNHDIGITSPVYESDSVNVIIDGTSYIVDVDYVDVTGPVVWTHEGNTSVPKDLSEENLDKEKVKGILTYSDGTTTEIAPTSVVLEKSTNETVLYISDGVVTYMWDAAVSE